MLCDAVITFFLVYADGHKEKQFVRTNTETAETFKRGLDRVYKKDSQCKDACSVEDFKVQVVPEFPCDKGI